MTTIAEHLRDEMLAQGISQVWDGDPDVCISAYLRYGGKVEHPLDRIKAVLDAARRSPLFERAGYILACDTSGRREIRHPVFRLKGGLSIT